MTGKPVQKSAETAVVAVEMSEIFDTRAVVKTLNGLMNKVTEKDCNADTVNAACNCASQITQLLRVHLDVERLKRSMR